ncbi:hypothetical protein FNV43_RR24859 [Rhamnella rubrinervis]|uniref:BHLH domain-containing protein n=1 Tax=Rhamnella rubrinervis TaxID=2594499 RepID=A0A8K0DS11_9ROSA|nr:hypothetical protein FNV43_RR24859 [Rhamnella rubrinervis]
MKDAVLPPFSSHIYDFGNSEVHMPNWDVSMQANNKITGFCMDDNQLRVEGYSFPIPIQPARFPTTSFHCDDDVINSHQSLLLGKKISPPQIETALQNGRKRALEINHLLPENGVSELISNEGSPALNEWRQTKRNKTTNHHEHQHWHHQVQEASSTPLQQQQQQQHRFRVPTVRRSQKLSDKITALQKLVSPYGKTDTASVLQEASVYIQLLHGQIQNLFRMLSSSYDSVSGAHSLETGKRRLDLRSKGLCLVPASYTQKVAMDQDHVDHHLHHHQNAISRKSVYDRNFYCLN